MWTILLISYIVRISLADLFFFLTDPPTTEIYPLSLHDALPISFPSSEAPKLQVAARRFVARHAQIKKACIQRVPGDESTGDRKSTRLNSSHANISYAVFCLKKKKKNTKKVRHTHPV